MMGGCRGKSIPGADITFEKGTLNPKILTIQQWMWKKHDRVGDITRNGEARGVLFKGIRPRLGELKLFG